MASKIIHARMKEETVVGCYDLLENLGIKTDIMPVSTIVAKVLQALIESQRNAGTIPAYDEEGLEMRVAIIWGDRKLNLEVPPMTLDQNPEQNRLEEEPEEFYHPDPPEQEEEEEPDTHARDIVSETVKRLSGGDIPSSYEVEEGHIPEPPRPKVDLDKVEGMKFSLVKSLSPKDRLVEAAGDDEQMQRAIGVAYQILPMDDWGGKQAEVLVKDIYEQMGE